MFPTMLIIFREILEVSIIIGMVMASINGVAKKNRLIIYGICIGVLSSILVGVFIDYFANSLNGKGIEIFNASILTLAIIMITWTIIWMKRNAKMFGRKIKEIGQGVKVGEISVFTLVSIIALAVLREGSEVVIFIYGLIASSDISMFDIICGSIIGIMNGSFIGVLLYFGFMRIPTKYFFIVSSFVLSLLAAGMASQLTIYLSQLGIINDSSVILWDSSRFLSNQSIFGKMLVTLIGYNDSPTPMQLIFYIFTFGMITSLSLIFNKKNS